MKDTIMRVVRWHIGLAKAVRQEPGLLFLFVVLPFVTVSLLILNQRVAAQETSLTALREALAYNKSQERAYDDFNTRQLAERIEQLERVVYVDVKGALDKKEKTPPTDWARQRDEELRKRLLALEQWRFEQQK